jgi:hypothetical protein
MRIVKAYPPNIDAIDAAFQVRDKPVFYAFGDVIYNPKGADITPELTAHEAVHGRRQLAGVGLIAAGADELQFMQHVLRTSPSEALKRQAVDDWWHRYIHEPAFRLEEEIFAHIAEFAELCRLHGKRWVSQRNMRRTYAAHVGKRLAAPLYGNLITVAKAKSILLEAAGA